MEHHEFIIESSGKWFIWTKHGRAPKFAHDTQESALGEAQRLAKLHPGNKFHVMQSIAKVSAPVPMKVAAPEISKEIWDSHEPNAVIDAHAAASQVA